MEAQTQITGEIVGVVTDPSGAAIPNATVSLKSAETGESRSAITGGSGDYRFSLLRTGVYKITVNANGFQSSSVNATAAVGTSTTANVKLSLGSSTQTVEVSESSAPLLHTENADISTTFNLKQIQQLPNPGNDITFVGQLAPGSIINTSSQVQGGNFGYGNFSSFGLPATSNNFTVNGTDENDPFFNVNNSGSTNILLGNNEVAEAGVTSNAYTAQFGGLGGAQVNEVTRAGTNRYHGNMVYWWNGSVLNANDYFNNQFGTPKPFDNANQWAASIGGPVKKDKLFFFMDTEGIRLLFPTQSPVYIPSPAYQAAILNPNPGAGDAIQQTVANTNPAEIPFYQKMFALYNSAPGAASAVPYNNNPFINTFRSNASSGANEWILTARADMNLGKNDTMFIRYKQDKGFQPSYTDPINPAFNLVSNQPSYEGQLVETHTFSPNIINQFLINGGYYRAIFAPPSLAANVAALPATVQYSDTGGDAALPLTTLNPEGSNSNGRNATQYGFADDLSIIRGTHNVKLGWNMKRNDITDFDPLQLTVPFILALGNHYGAPNYDSGDAYETEQAFPQRDSQPIALYQMGAYIQDTWKVKPNFTFNYGIRLEHNSNPICLTNCYGRLNGDFFSVAAANAANPTAVPYNQLITADQHRAFHGYQAIAVEPRIGFSWSPKPESNTVIRGGFGMFADVFPGTVADSLLSNPPTNLTFTVFGTPLDPTQANSGSALAQGNAVAFRSQFGNGGSFDSISATNPTFSAPNLVTVTPNINYPTYEEWSFQVEHQFGKNSSLSVGYVGNHGYHEPVQNNSVNAFNDSTVPVTGANGVSQVYFKGLPATAAAPQFNVVNLVQSNASSNYNGLVVTGTRHDKYVTVSVNYMYSHALDEISNGGILPFNPGNSSSPSNPFNVASDYGNADYDVRHNITGSYVIDLPYWGGPHLLADNWEFTGTIFFHTGFPFSIVDSALSNGFGQGSGGFQGPVYAQPIAKQATYACTSKNAVFNAVTSAGTPCIDINGFTDPTGFGAQRRNQFFGPHYVDTDFTAQKGFAIPKWEGAKVTVGAQFFNLFNHPNFAQPGNDIAGPNFGLITSVVSTPTSIYGNGLGGDASPRIVQLKASFTF